MEFKMYSKSHCPYCGYAEKWLIAKNFKFEKIVIDDDNERKAFYASVGNNVKTMPQIFVKRDGSDEFVRIGGYDDLIASKIEHEKSINLNDQDF